MVASLHICPLTILVVGQEEFWMDCKEVSRTLVFYRVLDRGYTPPTQVC